MADKQITHYGLDISGCEYLGMFEKCKLKCGSCYPVNCSDNLNCHYKQLKRKERECERLEEANNTLTVTREKLLGDLFIVEESLKDYTEHYNRQSKEVDQLKTENEELKSVRDMRMSKCEQEVKTSEFFQNELVKLKAQLLDQEAETLKAGGIIHILEKTLTEIKEIAERGFQHSQCNCGAKADLDLILQKICEVISE